MDAPYSTYMPPAAPYQTGFTFGTPPDFGQCNRLEAASPRSEVKAIDNIAFNSITAAWVKEPPPVKIIDISEIEKCFASKLEVLDTVPCPKKNDWIKVAALVVALIAAVAVAVLITTAFLGISSPLLPAAPAAISMIAFSVAAVRHFELFKAFH